MSTEAKPAPRSPRKPRKPSAPRPARAPIEAVEPVAPAAPTGDGAVPPPALVRYAPEMRTGFAMSRDGAALYYELVGPPAGAPSRTPVILCDGVGCDGYVWKYLLPELAHDRYVLHFHYRGHGRTPVPRDRSRIGVADCADDALDVADAARVALESERLRAGLPPPAAGDGARFEHVIVAGHSMGVQVGLEAFRRHRPRIVGLVLVCGAYGTPLRTFRGTRLLEDVLPAIRLAVHAVPRAVGALWRRLIPTDLAWQVAAKLEVNGELMRKEDFLPYLQHMAQVDPQLFVDMLAQMGHHTAREILERITVPTLIIAGDRDGFTPLSLSQEMHRLVPDSSLFVVRGGSHTAPIERPDEVTDAVASFVRAKTA